MYTTPESQALGRLLFIDAGTCAAMGGLLIVAGTFITTLTAIPATLLFYAGIVLLPVAALMAFTAIRPESTALVRLVVIGNALWVAASLLLVIGPWIQPNAFGYAFIIVQALVVTGLAALEFAGMGRMLASRGSSAVYSRPSSR
ncbi:hypothetical protein ACXYTJ_06790 [Gilvimarinus sp. F26214L]|uniref:hypothetical protein n=1 Tax=Gilvimarinus sp. DZF01 TaxID=3461371 RepID=UPI0040464D25